VVDGSAIRAGIKNIKNNYNNTYHTAVTKIHRHKYPTNGCINQLVALLGQKMADGRPLYCTLYCYLVLCNMKTFNSLNTEDLYSLSYYNMRGEDYVTTQPLFCSSLTVAVADP